MKKFYLPRRTVVAFLLVLVAVPAFALSFQDMKDTLAEMKSMYQGISTFIESLRKITGYAGFGTVVFLLAVLMVSSGLAALGLPRGLIPFGFSLLIVSSVWWLWNSSFDPQGSGISSSMIKANLIALVPVLLFFALSRGLPLLWKVLQKYINPVKMKKEDLLEQNRRIGEQYQAFNGYLSGDLSRAADSIKLSPQTRAAARNLAATLQNLVEKDAKNEQQ